MSDCTICCNEVTEGVDLSCRHTFHEDCIYYWLVQSPQQPASCPNCKGFFTIAEERRICETFRSLPAEERQWPNLKPNRSREFLALHDFGSDIECDCVRGEPHADLTCLSYNAYKGRYGTCAALLFVNQVDPNARNARGMTALHYAFATQDDDVVTLFQTVKILLQYGADPSLQTDSGDDVLQYAFFRGWYLDVLGLFPPSPLHTLYMVCELIVNPVPHQPATMDMLECFKEHFKSSHLYSWVLENYVCEFAKKKGPPITRAFDMALEATESLELYHLMAQRSPEGLIKVVDKCLSRMDFMSELEQYHRLQFIQEKLNHLFYVIPCRDEWTRLGKKLDHLFMSLPKFRPHVSDLFEMMSEN